MPTINQLVRQGRNDKTTKSKSPALNRGFNSLAKKPTTTNSPQNDPPKEPVFLYPIVFYYLYNSKYIGGNLFNC